MKQKQGFKTGQNSLIGLTVLFSLNSYLSKSKNIGRGKVSNLQERLKVRTKKKVKKAARKKVTKYNNKKLQKNEQLMLIDWNKKNQSKKMSKSRKRD